MLSILLPARQVLSRRIILALQVISINKHIMHERWRAQKARQPDDELIFEPRAQSSFDIIFQLNLCCHSRRKETTKNQLRQIIADSERFVELAGFGERFLSPARVHTHTNAPVWSASLSKRNCVFWKFSKT